jgi:hypothetical protein
MADSSPGIGVTIERSPSGEITRARIRFGPHHEVEVWDENGRTRFSLVATHHGFAADASEVPSELERIIEEIRRSHPDLVVD